MFLRNRNKKWYRGAWADHAKHAWNVLSAELKRRNIPVRSPSRLSTYFENAKGTFGSGPDRLPYVVFSGGEIAGGWWIGECDSAGSAHVARETDTGFWNVNIATHELAHHLEHHALCHDGHPAYMRDAGAPHWPYWRGSRSEENDISLFNRHVKIDDQEICITFIENTSIGVSSSGLRKDRVEQIARELIKKSQESYQQEPKDD